MSALFFLGTTVVVLWLGLWMFQEPGDGVPRAKPRAAPFDYAEIAPIVADQAHKKPGARWRERRATPGRGR